MEWLLLRTGIAYLLRQLFGSFFEYFDLIATGDLARSSGQLFCDRLNKLLAESGFAALAERVCERFYAADKGRPYSAGGLLPVAARGLLRWTRLRTRARVTLQRLPFPAPLLGLDLSAATPHQSSLGRIRQRFDV
jgi:hypothetical protein